MKTSTRLINVGRKAKYTGTAVNPRLVRASTITYHSVDEMERAKAERDNYTQYYGRRGTETTFAFREAMCELENAAGAYVFPCGSAAINSSLLAFLGQGDHVLMVDSVYEPTREFAEGTLKRFGVEISYYDPLIGSDIERLIQENTKVIFLESPGSWSMEFQDVPAIAQVARNHGVVTMIDNTFATPLGNRPLDMGVDISIHSATKYITGHSDVMLGVASANERVWSQLQANSFELGHCASPDDIYQALKGLRTMELRLRQHADNARQVAEWLQQRPEVDHVRHPAFASCPGNELFQRDFDMGNGLFSFVLKRHDQAAMDSMLDGMRHFRMGFSWGGYESLILSTSGAGGTRKATDWQPAGHLVRVHIGLEAVEDLIADLDAGLNRYTAAGS